MFEIRFAFSPDFNDKLTVGQADLPLTVERAMIEAGRHQKRASRSAPFWSSGATKLETSTPTSRRSPRRTAPIRRSHSEEAVCTLADRFGQRVPRRLRQQAAILGDLQHRAGQATPATAAAARSAALISYIVISCDGGGSGRANVPGDLDLVRAGAAKAN